MFVQWIQPNQTSFEELRSLAASFTAGFADAELWWNLTQPERPLLAFVGYRGRIGTGATAFGAMRRVCGPELLREWSAGAPHNTDDFPFIEFSAARSHLSASAESDLAIEHAINWLYAEEHRRAVR